MEFYNRLQLRKTASGIGFYIFTIIISMYFFAIIGTTISAFTTNSYSTIVSFLLDNIVSISSMFIIGLFYCSFSKTDLSEIAPIKRVSGKFLYKLVLIALSIAFIADYLTEIFLSGVSLFGIQNKVSMDYTTNNSVESILYIISVAIIPPLVEEFAFRGIILHKLRKYGDTFAVLISAVLFGLMHGNIVQIPFAFIAGIALGFVTVKSNSLIPSMTAHFMINFTSVIYSIAYDNKVLEENLIELIYISFIIIVIIGAVFSAIKLSKDKNFFKFEAYGEIAFKDRVKTVFTSTGIIFALIAFSVETVISVI